MKHALLFVSLAAAPACAEETLSSANSSSKSSSATTTALVLPPTQTAGEAPSFLRSHGIISSDELTRVLGAKLTPEQGKDLDQAVARRNAALSLANEELSATLRGLLGESNESLAQRAHETAHTKRLEEIRRNQPSRYFYLLERSKKRQ